MKRFIDLRGQGTGCQFSWWDTVRDEFEEFSNESAFESWNDFEECYKGDGIERYKSLCPEWVFYSDAGYESLWLWFGLSRASWLTIPRVLMHSMPDEWQSKMSKLLYQYDNYWDFNDPDLGTTIRTTYKGKLVKTPDWMKNYRHPDKAAIEALKKGKENDIM